MAVVAAIAPIAATLFAGSASAADYWDPGAGGCSLTPVYSWHGASAAPYGPTASYLGRQALAEYVVTVPTYPIKQTYRLVIKSTFKTGTTTAVTGQTPVTASRIRAYMQNTTTGAAFWTPWISH